MKLTLVAKEPLVGDVVSFVFTTPEKLTWLPGQYMKYTLPHDNADDRGIERWFTIAAPPYEGKPRITTRIVGTENKMSTFKRALDGLEIGATIEADAPEGDFVLADADENVFIAGGIGFTPFHAMLAELGHAGKMPKIKVLYGARDDEPAYHDELTALAAKYPQLELHYVIDPERVNEEVIRRFVSDVTKPHFYVSGPEPMVEAFEVMLKAMGITEAKLLNDYFPGYVW